MTALRSPSPPQPGFADPVFQSQAIFRTVLDALAHPGRISRLAPTLAPPEPLSPASAAILLALADYETPVWLDGSLHQAADFIRFHTGARICSARSEAAFAVVSAAAGNAQLAEFAQGSLEYPDRSATIIVQADRLLADGVALSGPGIDGEIRFGIEPAAFDLTAICRDHALSFPRGVDIIFVDAGAVAALPRSVRLAPGRSVEGTPCM